MSDFDVNNPPLISKGNHNCFAGLMFTRLSVLQSYHLIPFGNRSGLQRWHDIISFFRLGRECPTPALSIAGRVPSSSILHKYNACFNPPTMPSADFCTAVRMDYSTLSLYTKDTVQISQGKTRNFQVTSQKVRVIFR